MVGYKKKLTYIDANGYKRYTDSNKWVHRHVAEMKSRRKSKLEEVVHHINRNKLENHRSNLWVFSSQQAYRKIHEQDKKKYGRW